MVLMRTQILPPRGAVSPENQITCAKCSLTGSCCSHELEPSAGPLPIPDQPQAQAGPLPVSLPSLQPPLLRILRDYVQYNYFKDGTVEMYFSNFEKYTSLEFPL